MGDARAGGPVHAEAAGTAAAACDSANIYSSESTDAELDVAQPVTGDMDLAPGTLSYHARDTGWLGAHAWRELDDGHCQLASQNRANIKNVSR
eukprot:3898874-Pyramimonas_sp.AAC.2